MATGFSHTSFGTQWNADILLESFDIFQSKDNLTDSSAVEVRHNGRLSPRVPLRRINRGTLYSDGLRFIWNDEVTFDMSHGVSIEYCPGHAWAGALPSAFFSTMAALTLAWRGALPFHASAVEMAGKAVLILGNSGAGKSTLTAELLKVGARFIGDDLTVLRHDKGDAPVLAYRGRPGMRLHRDSAHCVPASDQHPVAGDSRGKWEVRPTARSMAASLPLAGLLVLDTPDGVQSRQTAAMLLASHLFRPRWLRALPGHAARLRATLAIAERIPCHGLCASAPIHRDATAVDKARRAIDGMILA